MSIDKAAHELLNFRAGKYSEYENGRWLVAYHEDQIYSVRDTARGIVTVCKARSPREAYWKSCSLPQVQVSQYGDNAVNISGSVSTLNL